MVYIPVTGSQEGGISKLTAERLHGRITQLGSSSIIPVATALLPDASITVKLYVPAPASRI